MDILQSFESSQAGKIFITFFVSMLPVIELRGAIPLGVSMGLGHVTSLVVSVIGNLLPVPFIILFIRRIFEWLRKKSARLERVVTRLENKAAGKRTLIYKSQIIGLILFVAIPLPGSGAWTGALIATVLGIRLKIAFPAISIGVILAGFLVVGLTYGFTQIVL